MIKFLFNLFFVSFLLNFVWEISQMVFYSEIGMGIRSDYLEFLRIHWEVTLKDALMVVAVYLLIGILLMTNFLFFGLCFLEKPLVQGEQEA